MEPIAAAGNTLVPALLVLEDLGFRLEIGPTEGFSPFAVVAGHHTWRGLTH